MKIVPELYCTNITENLTFFVDVLGFEIKYERKAEEFAYLSRDGVDIMLEGLGGKSRKWIVAELEAPFGRGINLQIDVNGVSELYNSVLVHHPDDVFLPLETQNYECVGETVSQMQFVVKSPDGYLLRFCEEL